MKVEFKNNYHNLHQNMNLKRVKRELINDLGSIIKSPTGNLNAEDEQRYVKVINEKK